MNILYRIAVTAACIAAISCNRESVPADGSGEIVFTADDAISAEVTTKTTVTNSLESTGFYASATTGGSSETKLWNNVSFSYSSGKFTGGKYWPATDNGIHFYASNADITFNAAGCSVNSVSANSKDVVCAYLASPSWKQENALTFNHIFARIGSVKVNAPSGYNVSSLNISITPYITGNYNIKTGTWSSQTVDSSSPSKPIAISASGTNENNLWVIPGTYDLTASYTLSKGTGDGAYVESFSKTASVTIVAGKIHSIETTLPAGNATEIVFTVSITPWANNSINVTF